MGTLLVTGMAAGLNSALLSLVLCCWLSSLSPALPTAHIWCWRPLVLPVLSLLLSKFCLRLKSQVGKLPLGKGFRASFRALPAAHRLYPLRVWASTYAVPGFLSGHGEVTGPVEPAEEAAEGRHHQESCSVEPTGDWLVATACGRPGRRFPSGCRHRDGQAVFVTGSQLGAGRVALPPSPHVLQAPWVWGSSGPTGRLPAVPYVPLSLFNPI